VISQASVLSLYDPDRSQAIHYRGEIGDWSSFLAALSAALVAHRENEGVGMRFLTETVLSVRAGRGVFTPAYHTPIVVTGLYWHFVDVIWLFLYALLYLIGRHWLKTGETMMQPIVPVRVYSLAFGILLALALTTTLLVFVDLGPLSLVLALGILSVFYGRIAQSQADARNCRGRAGLACNPIDVNPWRLHNPGLAPLSRQMMTADQPSDPTAIEAFLNSCNATARANNEKE
jgi:hypothetical protein